MSLIEDAVARLEQSRQQRHADPVAPTDTAGVVYSLKPAPAQDPGRPSAVGNAQAAGSGPIRSSPCFGGSVVLPEDKLKAAGLLTPASRANATGHQFRMLKAPILEKAFAARERQVNNARRVVVTSAVAGEGKTFCAINLAISIAAAANRSVLLIDADVAKPSIAEQMGLSSGVGLIDLLTRREHDHRKLILQTDLPGLAVLPAGRPEPHAGEYLATSEMTSLLDRLAAELAQYLFIIDTPPLLAVTETRTLVQQAGQTLLVVSAGVTARSLLDAALAAVAGASDVSLVLNKLSEGSAEFDAYYEY
jgi:protein-tyrosine kinase